MRHRDDHHNPGDDVSSDPTPSETPDDPDSASMDIGLGLDELSVEAPESEPQAPSSNKREILSFFRWTGVGIALGVLIGGVGFYRNMSSQHDMATSLIKADACLSTTTAPSGFCFNSAVTVTLIPNNPLSELTGSANSATISAPRSRIGIFANAKLDLRLDGLTAAASSNGRTLMDGRASKVTGTLSLAYSDLTHTLQSGSNHGASIFYAGNSEIGTSNQITYQGKQIPLVVISKIELKNNQLYLTPETVNALGRTAPASTVFSSVAPVPVQIAAVPKGLKYQSLSTSKEYLIFHLTGKNIALGTLFSPK